MPIIENSADRLALRSGSTTLVLDKKANTASLQRKMLFWNLKPLEAPLSDVTEVKLDVAVDRASGVDVDRSSTPVPRTGIKIGSRRTR
jgi:hypothetical protein